MKRCALFASKGTYYICIYHFVVRPRGRRRHVLCRAISQRLLIINSIVSTYIIKLQCSIISCGRG